MNDSHASASVLLYINRLLYRQQIHGLKQCIYFHTLVHQPATRQTSNIDLKPCISRLLYGTKCMGLGHASASIHLFVSRYETGTKCSTLCHVSGSIHMFISGLLDRYQKHGLEPCFCFHTLVNQLATRKAPNAGA